MANYELVIYWNKHDGSYIVDAPQFTGCMANGPNLALALKAIEEQISKWIDAAVAEGRGVPEPHMNYKLTWGGPITQFPRVEKHQAETTSISQQLFH